MNSFKKKKIVILEMANNHMGDVYHGKKIIEKFADICKEYSDIEFIFKLQFRDLDTFVHPSYQKRIDLKFIKRFEDTRLSDDAFSTLIDYMKTYGFKTMATPFDESSVDKIIRFKLDYLKIASASFGDWPLLEKIVSTSIPIVASTAGATFNTIDQVVSFFQHRNKEFALMHCIGEYPTPKEHMQLNQIDFLKNRYSNIEIGLSTHEEPSDTTLVMMCIAKGVNIFEKHVGLPTNKYDINLYSVDPRQFKSWLDAMMEAQAICGEKNVRAINNQQESKTLYSLRRGVYLKQSMNSGNIVLSDDIYLAFPPEEGQLTANDLSKYKEFILKKDMKKDAPLLFSDVIIKETREEIFRSVKKIKKLLKKSGITVPGGSELELSHHYGMDRFDDIGTSMITVVNREYCKKLIILLPGQQHPEQYHKCKEETFYILYGKVDLVLDGINKKYNVGDVITIEAGVKHSFSSKNGAVIEEISSTHYSNDSFYTDMSIMKNMNRKTYISFWMDT